MSTETAAPQPNSANVGSPARQMRQLLDQGRQSIEKRFRAGLPSVQTANALTQLYDDTIHAVYEYCCEDAISRGAKASHLRDLALVAHSGYGRRDLSPYSDADIMLLTPRTRASAAAQVASALVRELTDTGLDLGFSIRTPAEACALAWQDAKIYTALTESRLLTGNDALLQRFMSAFRKGARRRRDLVNQRAIQTRREERRKWGETIYLLSPNIKRSRGGLRDIQLVRWLAFATHGVTDISELSKLGALTDDDTETLRRAHAFLLRLRHELHFRRGRAQDVLDRPTQLSIAKAWAYRGRRGLLPVEEFMQDYFEHTRGVRYVSAFFDDATRRRSRTKALVEIGFSRRIDDDIRMGPTHIWVTKEHLPEFAKNLAKVLRLIQLAGEHRRRISHPTWQAIRRAMQDRHATPPDAASVDAFLGLLRRPGRLAPLLRRLHELRIIEQLIPAMRRCRGLLQFNAYHQYTVDAHCIRAVEAATEFETEESAMGRRYRRFKDKTLLHLALLIHDLGKGTDEDHSEVGRRIAGDVADSFGLDENSKETLQWLIAKHLLINETAFRHDLNDSNVVHAFATEVGSIGRLELLLVHSVADLKAVGPDVLNDWKMRLIEDLYLRTRRYFETGNLPGENDPTLDTRRQEVIDLLEAESQPESVIELVNQLPLSLLRNRESGEIKAELATVGQWLDSQQGSFCNGLVDETSGSVRYNVVSPQGERRIGMFARITSALHACGLQIFRANIETVGDDLLWDSFWVCDPDFADAPPQSRINHVCKVVRQAVDDIDSKLPVPRQKWSSGQVEEQKSLNVLPTKIVFDNETFDYQTILSIFTYDRPGLLADIATRLASDGISIQFAKIDTHLDQIADVFYITDARGEPILTPGRQASLRELLLKAIND